MGKQIKIKTTFRDRMIEKQATIEATKNKAPENKLPKNLHHCVLLVVFRFKELASAIAWLVFQPYVKSPKKTMANNNNRKQKLTTTKNLHHYLQQFCWYVLFSLG